MSTVAFRIWAAPVRRAWAEELHDSLDRDVPIVYDENPVPSKDPAQRWEVCKQVLRSAAREGKEYVGWIQDDALVCRDYCASVEAALDAAGSPILLSTYGGTGRPDQQNVRRAIRNAELKDYAFYPTRSLNFGVSVIFPTGHVETVIKVADRGVYAHSPADYRVGVALRDRCDLRTWYTLPSLAEHRDEGSLVGNDNQVRVAHRFLGQDRSGLEVDWTRLPPSETDENGRLVHTVTRPRVTSLSSQRRG